MVPPNDNAASFLLDVSASRLPLESGLRAAADECDRKTAVQLRDLADRLQRGEQLGEVLADNQDASSRFATAAVRAGMASSEFGIVLMELTELADQQRRLSRMVWTNLTYPIGLLLFSLTVYLTLSFYFLPFAYDAVRDFELTSSQVPSQWIVEHGLVLAAGACATFLIPLMAVRIFLGRIRWRWYLSTMPIVGAIVFLQGAWEFAVKLRMLVDRQIPLADSLEILASDFADANYADVSRRLAEGHRHGKSLAEQMRGSTRVPETLVTAIAWGENNDRLSDSLAMAADIFRERLMLHADFITSILPPVTYIAVAAITLLAAATFMAPLAQLLQMMGNLM